MSSKSYLRHRDRVPYVLIKKCSCTKISRSLSASITFLCNIHIWSTRVLVVLSTRLRTVFWFVQGLISPCYWIMLWEGGKHPPPPTFSSKTSISRVSICRLMKEVAKKTSASTANVSTEMQAIQIFKDHLSCCFFKHSLNAQWGLKCWFSNFFHDLCFYISSPIACFLWFSHKVDRFSYTSLYATDRMIVHWRRTRHNPWYLPDHPNIRTLHTSNSDLN